MRVLAPFFIFMHGFLTAPLLVECIPEDGRCIIEILGHDPCHENPGDFPVPAVDGTRTPTLTSLLHQVDTCTDLVVDGVSGISACTDYSVPFPQAPHGLVLLFQATDRSEMLADIFISRHGEGTPPAGAAVTRGILRI